jgi:hypothetical protein
MQGDKLYLAVLANAEAAARMASLGEEFLETHQIDGVARPGRLLHFSLIGFDLSNDPLAAAMPLAERQARRLRCRPFPSAAIRSRILETGQDRRWF